MSIYTVAWQTRDILITCPHISHYSHGVEFRDYDVLRHAYKDWYAGMLLWLFPPPVSSTGLHSVEGLFRSERQYDLPIDPSPHPP